MFLDFLNRSPLSPSSVAGSHALPSPVSPAATGTTATLTTPTKKTHQRSKSDATAAITASTRLMQVSKGKESHKVKDLLIRIKCCLSPYEVT